MEVCDLIIETTRRCNAACEHCLRGDAENLEMSLTYLDELFSRVSYISNLTFSEGEPSLAPHIIEETLQVAEKHGVKIGAFYIATNALQITDSFLLAILRLYCYCDNNDNSALEWSNDIFHPTGDTRRLEAFSFAHPKWAKERGTYQCEVLGEGRALECGLKCHPVYSETFEIEDNTVIEGNLYLNCEGNIIAGCDWSYDSQKEADKIICPVGELSLEKIEKFSNKGE